MNALVIGLLFGSNARMVGEHDTFDASHGDTIVLVMDPRGEVKARCEDAGGQLLVGGWCFDPDF